MIKIQFFDATAELNGKTWTCDDPLTLKMLSNYTSLITVGGHVPDGESFIVEELQKSFPAIRVISEPPLSDADDHPDTIY